MERESHSGKTSKHHLVLDLPTDQVDCSKSEERKMMAPSGCHQYFQGDIKKGLNFPSYFEYFRTIWYTEELQF